MVRLSLVTKRIERLSATTSPTLIAIDGHGGAGKTFLAGELTRRLDRHHIASQVVHFDDFYLPSRNRSKWSEKLIGGDFDWRRLESQVLRPLRKGRRSRYDVYDWQHDRLEGVKKLTAKGIIFIEGVYTTRPELARYYDLKIWVACPRTVCLARGLARDGKDVKGRWLMWMARESKYVNACHPHRSADILVDGVG